MDPIAKDYPGLTPYQFSSNMPIWAIDIDGLEAWLATNQAENTFSVRDWQNFVVAELKNISEKGIKFECTDLATYLMARYYYTKGVELKYYNPVTKETVSSNDQSWGSYVNGEEEGFNLFFWGFTNSVGADAYNNIEAGKGARNALANAFSAATIDKLGDEVDYSDIQLGDYGSTGKHTRVSVKNGGFWNYPLAADGFSGGFDSDNQLFVSGSQPWRVPYRTVDMCDNYYRFKFVSSMPQEIVIQKMKTLPVEEIKKPADYTLSAPDKR